MENVPAPKAIPSLLTHEDAILWFFSQLDWEMVGDLLDDNRTYENLPKAEFMAKLRGVFEAFENDGNTRLLIFPGGAPIVIAVTKSLVVMPFMEIKPRITCP